MKTITINQNEFSKIICGTNAFYGRSHFSDSRDKEYTDRFNDEYTEETLRFCMEQGMNTIETSANQRIWEIIEKVRGQGTLHLIGSTRLDHTSPMNSHMEKLNFLIERRAEICIIHSQFVERPGSGEIPGLDRMIEMIRKEGLVPGISAHSVSTVEFIEKKYDVDVYLFPLNMTGFIIPGYEGKETAQDRIDLIKGIDKTFILMKTLAAGRIPPAEGLSFVLENCKEKDIITIGIGSIEEAREIYKIAKPYMD